MPNAIHPHIHTSDLCKTVSERKSSLLHHKINITELAASPSLSSYAFSLKAFARLFCLLAIRYNIWIQFNYCITLHTLPQLNKLIFLEKFQVFIPSKIPTCTDELFILLLLKHCVSLNLDQYFCAQYTNEKLLIYMYQGKCYYSKRKQQEKIEETAKCL